VQINAQIAGNSQTIAQICNAEMRDFSHQTPIHELIRGSLNTNPVDVRQLLMLALFHYSLTAYRLRANHAVFQ
jgi:hypothetical protein